MAMPQSLILNQVRDVIRVGEQLAGLQTQWSHDRAFGLLGRWAAGCALLHYMLGPTNPWAGVLSKIEDENLYPATVLMVTGTLHTVERALENGYLVRIDDLVRAEILGDLVSQAEHLQSQGYVIPAGVLCRAAIEEHLRTWCARLLCSPQKPKPTIEDYKTALYMGKHITLPTMKHIDWMASIGNACAHNKGPADKDVEALVRDVARFLAQHPLPAPVVPTVALGPVGAPP